MDVGYDNQVQLRESKALMIKNGRRHIVWDPIATRSLHYGNRRWGQTYRLVRDILPFIAAGLIAFGTGQMAIRIGRRGFIAAFRGAAAAWPLRRKAHHNPRLMSWS
jgi:hypothetical protein